MKSVSKYLVAIVSVLLCLRVVADPNQLVTQGRAALAVKDLATANLRFQQAVAEDSNHAAANLYYAATRLAVVSQQPAANSFFDRLGISATGRSIYAWEAKFATNAQGDLHVPTGVSSAELFTFLHDELLPQIVGAGTNLAKITSPAFLQNVTASDTQVGDAAIDYSDVLVVRSLVHGFELFLYSVTSWNIDTQLTSLQQWIEHDTTLEQLFTAHPNLLATASSVDLPKARVSFTSAIDDYFQASTGLRTRPAGIVRLFNLDTNRFDAELHFRITMEDLRASLTAPVKLRMDTNLTVHAAKLFESVKSPRPFLPRLHDNTWVAGTIPDPTFGGIVQGVPLFEIEKRLEKAREPASAFLMVRVLSNGKTELQLSTPIWETVAVDVSTNLVDWSEIDRVNSFFWPAGELATNRHVLLDQSSGGGKRFYRAVSNPSQVTFQVWGAFFPLRNATVVFNPGEVRLPLTNEEDGSYSIGSRFLPTSQNYAVTISSPGYQTYYTSISPYAGAYSFDYTAYLSADPSTTVSPTTLHRRTLVLDAPPWEGSVSFAADDLYTLVTWFDYAQGFSVTQRVGNEWNTYLFANGTFPGAIFRLKFNTATTGEFIFDKAGNDYEEGTFRLQ